MGGGVFNYFLCGLVSFFNEPLEFFRQVVEDRNKQKINKPLQEVVDLVMAPAPIELGIVVNGNPNYIARMGDALKYSIEYQNSSGVVLNDVVLQATLVGDLFDSESLEGNGNIES